MESSIVMNRKQKGKNREPEQLMQRQVGWDQYIQTRYQLVFLVPHARLFGSVHKELREPGQNSTGILEHTLVETTWVRMQ